MSTDCTVRPLGPDDAEAWAGLRRQALQSHPLAFGSSVPDDPGLLREIALDRLRPSDESSVFGVFIEDLLVGIVGVRREEGAKERHKSMIWGMYVTPQIRRSGAGEMLLRTAIQRAQSWAGVEQVHLSVNDVAQDAKRLYEKNGFKEWGYQPRSLRWEGRYADEIHMILELPELR